MPHPSATCLPRGGINVNNAQATLATSPIALALSPFPEGLILHIKRILIIIVICPFLLSNSL